MLSYLRERFLRTGVTASLLVMLAMLKLTDHVLKVNEEAVENICNAVNIDEIQFGLCPGQGTTDVIFILRQL